MLMRIPKTSRKCNRYSSRFSIFLSQQGIFKRDFKLDKLKAWRWDIIVHSRSQQGGTEDSV